MTDPVVAHFDNAAETLGGAEDEAFGSDLGPRDRRLLTLGHYLRIVWWLNGAVRPGDLVLDLGCGTGRVTIPVADHLAHLGVRVAGVDASPRMIRWAETMRAERETVEFVVGDGRTLPALGPVAGFWSMLLFQHLPDELCSSYLAQLAERMREGARGIFQYVEGRDSGPLSHQATETQVVAWCALAGLVVARISADDPYSSDWRWVEVHR